MRPVRLQQQAKRLQGRLQWQRLGILQMLGVHQSSSSYRTRGRVGAIIPDTKERYEGGELSTLTPTERHEGGVSSSVTPKERHKGGG